ncbi:MAG: hypothetical protein O0V67_05810 [Methanocorpusculum sp.]|nr:hypothetical protein [Methanocorpusculum sp.]
MAKHRVKKPVEHSKVITTGVLILSAIVVIFTLVMVWRTYDMSPLSILIPSIEAAFCLTAKHYYAKAALENQIKLRQQYGDDAKEAIEQSQAADG